MMQCLVQYGTDGAWLILLAPFGSALRHQQNPLRQQDKTLSRAAGACLHLLHEPISRVQRHQISRSPSPRQHLVHPRVASSPFHSLINSESDIHSAFTRLQFPPSCLEEVRLSTSPASATAPALATSPTNSNGMSTTHQHRPRPRPRPPRPRLRPRPRPRCRPPVLRHTSRRTVSIAFVGRVV